MSRIHLFEFEDQPWCPALFRNTATDLLAFALNLGGHYACVLPKLEAAMERCGTRNVVDLCSGAGGPWRGLLRANSDRGGEPIRLTLTDRFPNLEAATRLEAAAPGWVTGRRDPVDATALPRDLEGFRTLFTSFHHFRPEAARAILLDAVNQGRGIGSFEITQRSPLAFLLMLLAAPLATPFLPLLPPWSPARLLLLPLAPVVALFALWDGLVSCLRTYSPEELRALVASLPDAGYEWDIGTLRYWSGWSLTPVTFLIGIPPRNAPPLRLPGSIKDSILPGA